MKKSSQINVQDQVIRLMKHDGRDYVCITDIAKQKNPDFPADVSNNPVCWESMAGAMARPQKNPPVSRVRRSAVVAALPHSVTRLYRKRSSPIITNASAAIPTRLRRITKATGVMCSMAFRWAAKALPHRRVAKINPNDAVNL